MFWVLRTLRYRLADSFGSTGSSRLGKGSALSTPATFKKLTHFCFPRFFATVTPAPTALVQGKRKSCFS